MAIIKCPECNNDVSDKALFCPHCGYSEFNKQSTINQNDPVSKTDLKVKECRSVTKTKTIVSIVVVVLLIFVIPFIYETIDNVTRESRAKKTRITFATYDEMAILVETHNWEYWGLIMQFDGSVASQTDSNGEFETTFDTYSLDYQNGKIVKSSGKSYYDIIEKNGRYYLRINPLATEDKWMLYSMR